MASKETQKLITMINAYFSAQPHARYIDLHNQQYNCFYKELPKDRKEYCKDSMRYDFYNEGREIRRKK